MEMGCGKGLGVGFEVDSIVETHERRLRIVRKEWMKVETLVMDSRSDFPNWVFS